MWCSLSQQAVAQGYEHAEGRLITISTVKALVGKLPEKLLTQWASLLFMPLVSGLVNDEDAACRQLLGATLQDLLQVCLGGVAAAAGASGQPEEVL